MNKADNKMFNKNDDLYSCDLNSSKRCNNCCKCLELEGYDMKAIEIDDLFDNDDLGEYEELGKLHDEVNEVDGTDEELWNYIDDIKDLKDLIEEDSELSLHEEYPGLFVYKKEKENKDLELNE
ncbi:hypothetical protein NBE98_08940 [Clostridium swellfunianum]|uniref:hypothetical protein n=1 Tax=Clostridium swellfunianum TaxID=1367462 RepID=UPI002030EC35|nr:hypothetical protein [Clostridium swellfunianum]MCM0648499.1 hypothetical protein [Clostridium swellfunianum]